MARISAETRARNEEAVRAAMDRLLKGDLPPGGNCDLKTLATEADVTRTAFYPKKNRDGTTRPGPYQHLAEEFERRLRTLRDAGEVVDPRISQIERLKTKVAELKERLTQRDETRSRTHNVQGTRRLTLGRTARRDRTSTRTGRSPRQRPPPTRRPPRNGPVRIVQLNLTSTDVSQHGEGARRRGLPRSLAVGTIDLPD